MATKFYTILVILIANFSFAQISTTRMNEIKIGMRPAEVLKLMGNKPAALADNSEATIVVKGVTFTISISNGYLSKNSDDMYVSSIYTTDKSIKTLSGLGIGSGLEDLWKTYSPKYNVFLSKEENSFREFRIDDRENGTMLIFQLKNDRVTRIDLNSYNPEECTL